MVRLKQKAFPNLLRRNCYWGELNSYYSLAQGQEELEEEKKTSKT
jgi:hypothetical protein